LYSLLKLYGEIKAHSQRIVGAAFLLGMTVHSHVILGKDRQAGLTGRRDYTVGNAAPAGREPLDFN
jgi:hypothetical protein